MRIQIDVAMQYRFTRPNTVFLAIEAADVEGQTILLENLDIGAVNVTRLAGDSNIGQRISALVPQGDMNLTYRAQLDITRPAIALDGLGAAPLHAVTAEALPYLRPSLYCQSDKFNPFVEKHFGHLAGGKKVQAMRDWIQAEMSYVPGSSDANTNVLETFIGREGVCRDYAHLMCAMTRAAGIPARMVAVYSPTVTPPDFHAVAEVWLENQWHLVDATGMAAADSMAVIAVGRDAYDIAFMESEAPAEMLSQTTNVIFG